MSVTINKLRETFILGKTDAVIGLLTSPYTTKTFLEHDGVWYETNTLSSSRNEWMSFDSVLAAV